MAVLRLVERFTAHVVQLEGTLPAGRVRFGTELNGTRVRAHHETERCDGGSNDIGQIQGVQNGAPDRHASLPRVVIFMIETGAEGPVEDEGDECRLNRCEEEWHAEVEIVKGDGCGWLEELGIQEAKDDILQEEEDDNALEAHEFGQGVVFRVEFAF